MKFGGGLHTRASSDEIDARECADGENFQLDKEDREYTNRRPFVLLGTVPNASEIRGFAQLLKTDGSTSMLVQAGTAVYEWSGTAFSSSKGTVSSTAQLRGRLEHNWQLDDKVLITDLNLQEALLEWDGTTLSTSSLSGVTNFRAKYCFVSNERAFFANLNESSTALPHVVAASAQGDYTTLSTGQIPSSARSIADEFQLLVPDLRAINGMVEAFGLVIVSTTQGSLFKITGNSAKTDETGFVGYAIDELYPRSAASGAESLAFVGNDIFYGRPGRLESVASTDKFGNVETDDLSSQIQDQIADIVEWTTVYNSRLDRVYFYPSGEGKIWVLQKSLLPLQLNQAQLPLSPWSKWTTAHASNFQPTAVMPMLDPVTNEEFIYFGDSSGNFYQLEGGSDGDPGSTDISTSRTSRVFTVPLDTQAFDVEGWIKYRKDEAATVTVTLLWQGQSIYEEAKTIPLPASPGGYYGGPVYYGDTTPYGSEKQKLSRKRFTIPGKSNEFQIQVGFNTDKNIRVNEVGLRFKAAS
ncbi:MAG: hypothetical protein ACR2OV_15815 [Hyphomicrobiaceae bacterium]